jgi:hypothetical protein
LKSLGFALTLQWNPVPGEPPKRDAARRDRRGVVETVEFV